MLALKLVHPYWKLDSSSVGLRVGSNPTTNTKCIGVRHPRETEAITVVNRSKAPNIMGS